MRKVYGSQLFPMVGHLKTVLECHGIGCTIKNEFLGGAAGEIPPVECWPELWIIDDDKYNEAAAIVDAISLEDCALSAGKWVCLCGENIESQFTDCWHCGASRMAPVQR